MSNDQRNNSFSALPGQLCAVSDGLVRSSSQLLQTQQLVYAAMDDILHLKEAIEETEVRAKMLDINQQMFRQNILPLTEEINNRSGVSYDGTFLWKITNFQQNMSMHSESNICLLLNLSCSIFSRGCSVMQTSVNLFTTVLFLTKRL